MDDIEFLLATRDAPEGRPLAKSASGGERSRVMLALEVVFAGMDPVPTFVFDEVEVVDVEELSAYLVNQRLQERLKHWCAELGAGRVVA